LPDRHHAHARVVGHVDQVERRLVDEILIAGHAAQVARGDEAQRVRRRVVGVGPVRQRDVDVDLLGIERGRRRASAVAAVNAVAAQSRADRTGNGRGLVANSRDERRLPIACISGRPPRLSARAA